jgi:hypothetical protein
MALWAACAQLLSSRTLAAAPQAAARGNWNLKNRSFLISVAKIRSRGILAQMSASEARRSDAHQGDHNRRRSSEKFSIWIARNPLKSPESNK